MLGVRTIGSLEPSGAPETERQVKDLYKTLKDKQRDLRSLELDIRDLDKALI